MNELGYKKINKIVMNDLIYGKISNDNVDLITKYAEMIMDMEEPKTINKEWSRTIPLQESINIVYDFLNEVDVNLANQFMNLVYATNDKGEPIVEFNYYEDESGITKSHANNHHVIINYSNTPGDMFTILHEMLHMMNSASVYSYSYGTDMCAWGHHYFGETVSILGELLLKEYAVKNNYITTGDFNRRYILRIKNSHVSIRSFMVEKALLGLRMNCHTINEENLKNYVNSLDEDSVEAIVLNCELKDHKHMRKMLANDKTYSDISKKYIIAMVYANLIKNGNNPYADFVKLNDNVASVNKTFNDIHKELKLSYPSI